MKEFIKLLERKIEGCDSLGGMEREKAVYQSVLKDYRKAITVTPCCTELKSIGKLEYNDWKDKIGLIKEIDMGVYKLNGDYITVNEVLDMYDVYCDTF